MRRANAAVNGRPPKKAFSFVLNLQMADFSDIESPNWHGTDSVCIEFGGGQYMHVGTMTIITQTKRRLTGPRANKMEY